VSSKYILAAATGEKWCTLTTNCVMI